MTQWGGVTLDDVVEALEKMVESGQLKKGYLVVQHSNGEVERFEAMAPAGRKETS